jgi:hypothetical protein
MAGLGKKIVDFGSFISFLHHTAPFLKFPNAAGVMLMKTMPREGLHIVIQRLFSTIGGDSGARPQFLDALYEATMIGTGGLPLPGYNKVFFGGTAIFQFLAKNFDNHSKGPIQSIDQCVDVAWRRYVDDFWCNVAQTKHRLTLAVFHPVKFLVKLFIL